MEKEDAEEMYRKWRERKGVSDRSDVEKETDREKYKRALMEAEEEKDPFETKAIGIGFTEDEPSGRREKTDRESENPFETDAFEDDWKWKWAFFSFEGSLERKRYIIGSVGLLIGIIIMWIVGIIIAFGAFGAGDAITEEGIDEDSASGWYLLGMLIFLGMMLISLLTIWPDAAMAAKRLRDMGQEPGLAALFVLLPLVPFVGGLGKLGMWIWLMVADTEKR